MRKLLLMFAFLFLRCGEEVAFAQAIQTGNFPRSAVVLGSGSLAPSTKVAWTTSVSTFADLKKIVDSIGSTAYTLMVDKSVPVTANLTLPKNINVAVIGQGAFNRSAGDTLYIQGPLYAPDMTIFTGSGVTVFNGKIKPDAPVQWWGAVCDSSTDDQSAINAALTSAGNSAPGMKVHLPDGYCRTSAAATVPSGVEFYGQGPGRSFIDLGTNNKVRGISTPVPTIYSLTQTSDLNFGDTSNTITTPGAIAAGDFIFYNDTAYFTAEWEPAGSVRSYYTKKEFFRVKRVAGTTIIFTEPSVLTLPVSKRDTALYFTPAHDVKIHGLTIQRNAAGLTAHDSTSIGIDIRFCDRCQVYDALTLNTSSSGITTQFSMDVNLHDISTVGAVDSSTGTNYGIVNGGSKHVEVVRTWHRHHRHGIANGTGTHLPLAMFSHYTGFHVSDNQTMNSIDTHGGSYGITFDNGETDMGISPSGIKTTIRNVTCQNGTFEPDEGGSDSRFENVTFKVCHRIRSTHSLIRSTFSYCTFNFKNFDKTSLFPTNEFGLEYDHVKLINAAFDTVSLANNAAADATITSAWTDFDGSTHTGGVNSSIGFTLLKNDKLTDCEVRGFPTAMRIEGQDVVVHNFKSVNNAWNSAIGGVAADVFDFTPSSHGSTVDNVIVEFNKSNLTDSNSTVVSFTGNDSNMAVCDVHFGNQNSLDSGRTYSQGVYLPASCHNIILRDITVVGMLRPTLTSTDRVVIQNVDSVIYRHSALFGVDSIGHYTYNAKFLGTGWYVGKLGLNLSDPSAFIDGSASLEIAATAPEVNAVGYGGTPGYLAYRAQGTQGSPTALADGNTINRLWAAGRDNSAWSLETAELGINADSLWTTATHGSFFKWIGTPAASITNAEWMRLYRGNLIVGSTSNTGDRLQINGTARFASTVKNIGAVLDSAGHRTVGPDTEDNLAGSGTRIVTAGSTGILGSETSSAALDAIGSTRGSVLYRGASAWDILTPGTSGFALISNGSGADPSYSVMETGSGTANTVTKWTNTNVLGNSNTTDDGTTTTIGGTNTRINSLIGIGGAATAGEAVYIQNTGLTGTGQIGLDIEPTFSTAASSQVRDLYLGLITAANDTVVNAKAQFIAAPSLGSLTKITNLYALDIGNQSGATTNWAIHTGTGQIGFGDNIGMPTYSAANAININASTLAGVTQEGISINPTFQSDATSNGIDLDLTPALKSSAAMKQTNTKALLIEAASIPSGDTSVNLYGIDVAAQVTRTGGTNAYGIRVAQPSGGSGSNIALQITGTGYNMQLAGAMKVGQNDTIVGTLFAQGSAEIDGDLALFGTGSFGGGSKVVFVKNATTDPTTNPSGGGILYASSGAGKWRGSSGTVTTFGPAGKHCGHCGYDFWIVASENEKWHAYLYVCGVCGHRYFKGPKSVLKKLSPIERSEIIHD